MKPTNNKMELTKFQGFDLLEKLPEEKMLNSYNEEFYNTLHNSNIKVVSLPIIQDHKLFYHYVQNENASVSTSIGQLLSTYDELDQSSQLIKHTARKMKEDIKKLKEEIVVLDKNIYAEYYPEISKMTKILQKILIDQKTENFKLIKEIAILEKEKSDIQNSIYMCLGKLHKLEREVGVKSKAYTYLFDQSLIENEISNKFVIEREDI